VNDRIFNGFLRVFNQKILVKSYTYCFSGKIKRNHI